MNVINPLSCGVVGSLSVAQATTEVRGAGDPMVQRGRLLPAVFAGLLSLVSGAGCYPRIADPLRVEEVSDFTSGQLRLHPGRTSLEVAERRMRRRHMSGIVSDRYAPVERNGPLLGVLAADYQMRVHFFREGFYRESIELHSGNVVPYGFALNISSSAAGTYMMVLYRDPLEMTNRRRDAEEPRIEIYRLERESFAYQRSISIARIADGNGGMTRPIFVGHNLDDGVLFL